MSTNTKTLSRKDVSAFGNLQRVLTAPEYKLNRAASSLKERELQLKGLTTIRATIAKMNVPSEMKEELNAICKIEMDYLTNVIELTKLRAQTLGHLKTPALKRLVSFGIKWQPGGPYPGFPVCNVQQVGYNADGESVYYADEDGKYYTRNEDGEYEEFEGNYMNSEGTLFYTESNPPNDQQRESDFDINDHFSGNEGSYLEGEMLEHPMPFPTENVEWFHHRP